jgi:predicted Zn-dependent protease
MPMVVSLCGICLGVAAQTRHLPKASFQSLTGGSGGQSSSYGLHLTPGFDRAAAELSKRYAPGEPDLNMALVRWQDKKMPLLIWISPGIQLPDCPASQLKDTRVDLVTEMLNQQGDPFIGLKPAPSWTAETNDQVAAGFEQWRQFQGEGLFRFAFTDDPRQANICVFFVDAFKEGSSPGGVMIGGNTAATVYQMDLARSVKIKQKPVVMELSTLVNETPEKMTGAAAHEFGHALGIKAHSPYRDDIMFENRIVDQLSPADKETIRWLYHQNPQYVM